MTSKSRLLIFDQHSGIYRSIVQIIFSYTNHVLKCERHVHRKFLKSERNSLNLQHKISCPAVLIIFFTSTRDNEFTTTVCIFSISFYSIKFINPIYHDYLHTKDLVLVLFIENLKLTISPV